MQHVLPIANAAQKVLDECIIVEPYTPRTRHKQSRSTLERTLPVDTKHAKQRELRFANVAELIAELDRIESAYRDGSLATTGNWTPGQILSHLAAWIEYAYDGFPLKAPPFFVRWFLKLALKSMLKKGTMSPGVSIPSVEGGTLGQEDMEFGAAMERYRVAISRMQSEPAIHNSPAFGKVTDEVRIRMNLMHAQLHLGFLEYAS